ncbi:alpha/beta fold hydrolase [Pseudarthrobacter sp. NamE5]|uniref:alpha/beta fold hydrolase n=1 Tax=Pseudarthrobacter sp. NamE5 TaxID=2576839 RepID=UPI00110BA1C7|nr:alpha/beta hydrolase [Pseudarthrobacter sp. NamE5]TLM87703.1 alpha/beta hydrolase [Pseudarthrobacter sp. NamE5]
MTVTHGPARSFLIQTGPEVTINCYALGPAEASPVVILHGLAGSAREFIETARALPEFQTVLVELRGHGGSTTRPGDLSREAFVADVVRVTETVVSAPVTLVGQSMGGHTAMLVAAARPDLVSRLVLLESGAGGGNEAGNDRMGDYFRSWPLPFPDRAAARAFLGDAPLERAWVEDLEERPDGLWPRFEPDIMVATMNAMVPSRWDEWERITAPALVVYGEHGMFADGDRSEFCERGVDVQRVDLAGGSHDSHLDAFDSWIAALRGFLLP